MLISRTDGGAKKQHSGFTLVELVVMVVIIGILAVVAVTAFNSSQASLQYQIAIKRIASDVRYAQQAAIAEGEGAEVHIDVSNNRYYLKWSNGNYLKKPVGGDDYIVQFGEDNFALVEITATGFTNGRLDFDISGAPTDAGSAFSGKLSLVTLNNAQEIWVSANTGFLQIVDL